MISEAYHPGLEASPSGALVALGRSTNVRARTAASRGARIIRSRVCGMPSVSANRLIGPIATPPIPTLNPKTNPEAIPTL